MNIKKNLLTLLLLVATSTGAFAQSATNPTHLRIYQKDGTTQRISLNTIDSLTFESDEAESAEAEVARVELTLATGHFHGKLFHQDAEHTGTRYLRPVQRIALVRNATGWERAAGSDSVFRVVSSNRRIQPYGLWIKYFDEQGRDITASFVEAGEDSLHQHFFTPQNVQPTAWGTAEADDQQPNAVFDYVYMDTSPWNMRLNESGVELVGSKVVDKNEFYENVYARLKPVGMKGFFAFRKDFKRFDLRIRLMHADEGKFLATTDELGQNTAPFFAPTAAQLANAHWEADFAVPVVSFITRTQMRSWTSTLTPTTRIDELTEVEQNMVRATAKAFSISESEALNEWYNYLNSPAAETNDGLWF